MPLWRKNSLAIVWAVRVFRPYLYGHKFEVITDHCPLSWLKMIKEPTGRLVLWMYRAGKQHTNADSLSRRPHHEQKIGAMGFQPQWTQEDVIKLQADDPVLSVVLQQLPQGRPQFVGQ